MYDSLMPRKWTPKEMAKKKWVLDNPGKIEEVSKETGASRQMVHLVLYGDRKSSNGAVERALKRRQAPGIL